MNLNKRNLCYMSQNQSAMILTAIHWRWYIINLITIMFPFWYYRPLTSMVVTVGVLEFIYREKSKKISVR